MVQLLDLDLETHRTIIEQLPVQHLSALSCTCRHFRSCVLAGSFAEKLWRNKCRQQVGEGLLSLHQAGVPQGLPPTAQYWRHLCYHAEFLDHVRWWKDGSDIVKLRADEADARAVQAGDEPGPSMKARLARSGHSASVIGHLLVASGGILRDISLYVDIVIMDLNTLAFIKPEVYGAVPMTRFRHTGVVITPEPLSKIGALVNQVLKPLQRKAEHGSTVLLFGGYNTMGQEFGGDQFEAFWVSHDGSAVAWLPVKTHGHAPSARFHHTTTSFDGGRQLILYGGEGHEMIDAADNQAPNVYTLDVTSLTWHRRSTTCISLEDSPGVRSLHLSTVRRCPETGHEELVVVAGYCNNVLAAMNPHRLDLTTWSWVKESGLVPNPGHGDALALPTPRQRAAAEKVADKWLLMLGGSPTQFLQGNFLDDMHKLHLPTLTWRAPPKVHGRPIRALRNIAGHSMEGLIAFGGCVPTVMGIMPVAKADPLLIGPPPGLNMLLEQEPRPPLQTLHPQQPAPLPISGHTGKLPLYHQQQQHLLAGQPSRSQQAAALQQPETVGMEPRPSNGPQAGFASLPLPYEQQGRGEATAVQARGDDQQADVREPAGDFQQGGLDHWQGSVQASVDSVPASVDSVLASVDAVHQGRGSKRQAPAHETAATAKADSSSRQVGSSSHQLLHVAVGTRQANDVDSQMQSPSNDLVPFRRRLLSGTPETERFRTTDDFADQLTEHAPSQAQLGSGRQPALPFSNAQDPFFHSLGVPDGAGAMHDQGHADDWQRHPDGQVVSRHQGGLPPRTLQPSQAGTSSEQGPSGWDATQQDPSNAVKSVLVEGAARASSNPAQANGQGNTDTHSTSLQVYGGNADGSSWDPQQAVWQGYVARSNDGSELTWVRRFPDAAWRSITVAPDLDTVQTTTDPEASAEEGESNDQAVAQSGHGADRCSPCDTYDGTFTAWRVPTGTESSEPGAAARYWRHEATGEFYLRQDTQQDQVLFVPVQGPSSQSSDSGSSPLASFQPADDLVEVPPAQVGPDPGPCLMQ
ncbi:hypothetical protein WJX77_006779 [Trebouxia sp. C0004]